jgi:hypothetical protein
VALELNAITQLQVVVAQVSSTFTVVVELNVSEIDFSYLPMDVVCNGRPLLYN